MTHTSSKKKATHAHVVLLMKEMGYGLMTDNNTFYKLGHELVPREWTTFTMTQAYEIHELFRAKLANGFDSDNTKERIGSIVDYVDGCTKLPEDKLFSAPRAAVEHRIGEMFVSAVSRELTQALKELKEEANLIEANDKWGGTNIEPKRAVTVEVIDQKIKELGGE